MNYSLQLVPPDDPIEEPITVDEVKVHCAVTDDLRDDYIATLITVARLAFENEVGRAIGAQTFELGLRGWWPWYSCPGAPYSQVIQFPRPPLIEVLSIKYTPLNAAEVTLYDSTSSPVIPCDLFTVDKSAEPGELWLRSGNSWPTDNLDYGFPIRIRFRAGLTIVPQHLKHALLMMVAHLFENREPVLMQTGTQAVEIPRTIAFLVQGLKYDEIR